MTQAGALKLLEDATLVRMAQVGNLDAFDELARRYRPALTALCRSVHRDADCAHDLTQDALVAAYRNLRSLREPERFGPWVRMIARRAAMAESRAAKLQQSALEDSIDRAVVHASHALGEREALDRLELADLYRELHKLPAEWAEPLSLQACEGWDLQRIAAFLDLPVSTVKWRMFQARKRLNERARFALGEES